MKPSLSVFCVTNYSSVSMHSLFPFYSIQTVSPERLHLKESKVSVFYRLCGLPFHADRNRRVGSNYDGTKH